MGAAPKTNRSAKGGIRSSLHYGGEGVLIHPPHQGVCGRHGTEEQRVTSGELAPSQRTYKRKRNGKRSAASSRTAEQYLEAWPTPRDRAIGDGTGSGKAAGEDSWEEREGERSKDVKEDQFHA